MSEPIIFSDENVLITAQTLRLGHATYKTNDIRRVQLRANVPRQLSTYTRWSRLLTYALILLIVLDVLSLVTGSWNEPLMSIGPLPLSAGGISVALMFIGVIAVSL